METWIGTVLAVGIGWALSQVTEKLRHRRDQADRRNDREIAAKSAHDECQRTILMELQGAMEGLWQACLRVAAQGSTEALAESEYVEKSGRVEFLQSRVASDLIRGESSALVDLALMIVGLRVIGDESELPRATDTYIRRVLPFYDHVGAILRSIEPPAWAASAQPGSQSQRSTS